MTTTTFTNTERAAQLFHALSDETRLSVIELLSGGDRCVCELTDALDVAQSRLSFHLKVLKDAGVLLDRREGRWVYYSLNPSAFDEAQSLLAEMKPHTRRLAVRSSCCVADKDD